MKRYEKYKDSGVDWIGEIPESWKVRRIKTLFKEINERSFNGSEDLLSVSQYTGVTRKSDKVEEGDLLTNASTLEGYKIVKKGDLVSNIMLAWNGSLGFSPFEGITSPAYSVYRLKDSGEKQFFHYLFRTEKYKAEFKRQSSGVIESRLRLYSDDFFGIFSILPPLSEQQSIATFLDDKTAKIDQTIAIKEKEIELLKERRQILVQKAVTKGLDDTVKLKDSGVDWIGEIPAHWEVRKITYLFSKIGSGTTPTSGDLRYYDGVVNFLQTGDLNDGYLISTSKTLKEKALRDFTSLKIYPKESLVIAMYGATIGKLGILNIDSATNQACCVLSNPRNVLTKYFFFVLLAFRKEIVSMGYGGGQPNISQDLIKSLRFPIANLNEQIQIVSYLETIEEKISKAILLKQQEIEQLKEYKTVLIDNVVTGKVKIN